MGPVNKVPCLIKKKRVDQIQLMHVFPSLPLPSSSHDPCLCLMSVAGHQHVCARDFEQMATDHLILAESMASCHGTLRRGEVVDFGGCIPFNTKGLEEPAIVGGSVYILYCTFALDDNLAPIGS